MTAQAPQEALAAALEGRAWGADGISIPDYLEKTYWWAYVRPWAVRLFEREWLVNLILWGWYKRLRDETLAAMARGGGFAGKTLKISCCYGTLEPLLAGRIAAAGGTLDILDVAPEQLRNAARKMPQELAGVCVRLHHMDAVSLAFEDGAFDRAMLFFLPHEQPEAIRRKTLEEALRVVKAGGSLYVTEFSRCSLWHPLKYIWHTALRVLEPYAAPLWTQELAVWLPRGGQGLAIEKRSFFGGFYQIVRIEKRAPRKNGPAQDR